MSNEQITIPLVTAQILFDTLVHSMDFGSGFLDSEAVEALRGLAVAIGVDPNKATPHEFKGQYPHPFAAETDRNRIAQMVGALTQAVGMDNAGWPATINVVDESKMPRFVPCKVGPYSRKCGKPADASIHSEQAAVDSSPNPPAVECPGDGCQGCAACWSVSEEPEDQAAPDSETSA